jgi:hypothetical protein
MERDDPQFAGRRPHSRVALGVAVVLAFFGFANAVAFMSLSESPASRLVVGNESQVAPDDDASDVVRAPEQSVTAPSSGGTPPVGLTPGGIAPVNTTVPTLLESRQAHARKLVERARVLVRRILERMGLSAP